MSTKKHTKTHSTYAFESNTNSVAASQMRNALNKLADSSKLDDAARAKFENELDSFFTLFRRYLVEKSSRTTLEWDKIKSPNPDEVVKYEIISQQPENVSNLSKLAVLKLNGGLGTSMGCVGPKSVIEVREGNTFLDLSVRQIEYLNRQYDSDNQIFNQSRFPRVYKDSLLPVPTEYDSPLDAWYPPGHGDLFESLHVSGELDALIAQGREILFVSNGDNLGATVDLKILNHMIETGAEYIMELTDKTRADVKGGTLISYDGQVRLLEVAQVPKEHIDEFKNIRKFTNFNTNNLWINLKAVKRLIESSNLEMEIIPNQKTITRDGHEINVLQLETACGAAIRHFDGAHGVVVPRSRFLPVKTCSDLLLVKSDLFRLEHGSLKLDPSRFGPNPLIKLGSHFKKVSGFNARIPHIPKIVELDHLTITGNVFLGKDVTLRGTVIIVCSDGHKIDIPNGSILENVVVTGNLQILEH
ncbi:UTP--glucose-1-phosphate uridylyltransferase family protein [Saccharomyces cerevisiae]|nr:UTP--glucose-1-phosphate uridylyltransferase family protein [Saccharomyces cerevisiae]